MNMTSAEQEEARNLLYRTTRELEIIRNEQKIASARLEMFDSVMMILTARVEHRGGAMTPDIVHEVKMFLDKTKSA